MRYQMGRLAVAGLVLAASWLAPTSARANLVTNGSFEMGSYPGGAFATLGSGSTAITGWTVTGSSVDWINSYWQPSDGAFSVDLDGNGQGGLLSDPVATTIGQSYRVTFDMAGNPDGLPVLKALMLTAGSSFQLFQFDTTGQTRPSMGWQTMSFIFTADAVSTSLRFDSQDPGFYGAALDNVSMEAVPEPGTLLLVGSGISALALRRRRKA